MQGKATEVGTSLIVERGDLQRLIDALLEEGYLVIGPILRDGAIIYDEMTSVADLPVGWTDEQDGGMGRTSIRSISRGAGKHSSSQSTAERGAARAFVSR